MGNNPIVYTDEDGDFVWNLIIGAITGGIVDMAFQVGEQMLSGQNFGSAIEKVDWEQVGWSTLEGAGDALWSSPAGMLAKMTKKLSKYPKLKELMGEIGEVVYEMGKAALKQYNEKGLDGLTGEWFAMAFEDALISRGLDHLIHKKTPSVSTTKAQVGAAKDNFEKVMKTSQKNDIASRVSAKKQVTNSLEAHGSNVITQVGRNNLIKKAVTKGAQNVNTSDGGGRPKRTPGPIPSF